MTTTVQNVCDLRLFDPEFTEIEKIDERSENSNSNSSKKIKKANDAEDENEECDGSLDFYKDIDHYRAKAIENKIMIQNLEKDNIDLIKERNVLRGKIKQLSYGRSDGVNFENIIDHVIKV